MKKNNPEGRRKFINSMAFGAAASGLSMFAGPVLAAESRTVKNLEGSEDSWLGKIKGAHKVVIDSPGVNGANVVHWAENLYLSFEEEGVSPEEVTVVCVLRHYGIFLGLNTEVWNKYSLSGMAKLTTPMGVTLENNPLYEGDSELFGYEMSGIKGLMEKGAVFVICGQALEKGSQFIAEMSGMDKEEAKKDFMEGVFPGIEVVSTGVWAVTRAQEQGCAFIYASN